MSSTIDQGGEPPASADVVEPATGQPGGGTINIRNISIKCGNCNTYQTLATFSRRDEWNVYTYECENDTCDPDVTRTLVEVPQRPRRVRQPRPRVARRQEMGRRRGVAGRAGLC